MDTGHPNTKWAPPPKMNVNPLSQSTPFLTKLLNVPDLYGLFQVMLYHVVVCEPMYIGSKKPELFLILSYLLLAPPPFIILV